MRTLTKVKCVKLFYSFKFWQKNKRFWTLETELKNFFGKQFQTFLIKFFFFLKKKKKLIYYIGILVSNKIYSRKTTFEISIVPRNLLSAFFCHHINPPKVIIVKLVAPFLNRSNMHWAMICSDNITCSNLSEFLVQFSFLTKQDPLGIHINYSQKKIY